MGARCVHKEQRQGVQVWGSERSEGAPRKEKMRNLLGHGLFELCYPSFDATESTK